YMRDFLNPEKLGVMSAETVARIVFKAATAKHPHTRYNVGLIAHLGPIGRALTPDRVVDFMTRRKVPVQKP
nr:short-chain dehydrogenase/reductase [Afipia sp.]